MSGLKVNPVRVTDLKEYSHNTRVHPQKQIKQLAKSITEYGLLVPLLIDSHGALITGHARVAAARQIGLETVPAICIEHLTEDQVRAFRVADNKIAENAEWDRNLLAIEFQELMEVCPDIDLTITGFEAPEVDLIIQDLAPEEYAIDEIPEIDESKSVVTQLGDHWIMGNHSILCGDARNAASYERLLGDELASLIFTDPPYNVRVNGHVCGKGSIKHDEFAMASGEMLEEEFEEFLRTFLVLLVQFSSNGSLHFACMDWRHIRSLLNVGKGVYTELKNICVWNKDNSGMGSMYRSKHELIAVLKNGNAPHVNNVELGRYGRNRTNVWDYPGVNSLNPGRLDDLRMHPTVKPAKMFADVILDASHRGDIVLDPFCGSGTVIVAAEQTGRRARAIEIESRYVDVSVRRWQKLTGSQAIHAETQRIFDDLRAERLTKIPMAGSSRVEEVDHVKR